MAPTAHAIPELDRKGLRSFGLTTGGILAVLFGLFFPWLLSRPIPLWPWVVAGVMILWGLAVPDTLRPVYRTWMRFGLFMSRITTPLILGIAFYLVVTPIALVRMACGFDSMARSFDRTVKSYRVTSRGDQQSGLERPY
jgi:O-antigen/teichoic acid export membrane protein